jgi:8-oxo-dGTP pyrophosphatase MutT (NUDIX family)
VTDRNPDSGPSVASVVLPDNVAAEQYLIPPFRCAATVVLDESMKRMLLSWRQRFVTGEWGWELPGGRIDPGEDGPAAAARMLEEETGYRPRTIEHIMTFQPTASTADSGYELYLALGAEQAGTPATTEPETVRWIPVSELPVLISAGTIIGATIIGAQQAQLAAARPGRHAFPQQRGGE